jgi:hypothetical protein
MEEDNEIMRHGFNAGLLTALNAMEEYQGFQISEDVWAAENTPVFLSPSPVVTGEAVYAVTAEAVFSEDGVWIVRFYLWEMEDTQLLGMDWLQAYDLSEYNTFVPFALAALFANIPVDPEPIIIVEQAPPVFMQPEPSMIFSSAESDPSRLTSVGVSAGSALSEPLIMATVRGTISPLRYTFLELGINLGFLSLQKWEGRNVPFFSMETYAHIAFYLPITALRSGWYIGAGGGFIFATYGLNDEVRAYAHSPAVSAITGFNIFDIVDVSYTVRIFGFANFPSFDTMTETLGSKISVGVIYRF